MTSTLTLYYNSLLNKEKNFILDDLSGNRRVEEYLSTLPSFQIENYQYVKHSLALIIKVDLPQSQLMMGENANDLNYIKIQNGNETPLYYFVVHKEWKSKYTIQLSLNLDTLNSFKFNEDYLVNERTLVHREHEDRFSHKDISSKFMLITMKNSSSGTFSFFFSNIFLRYANVTNLSFEETTKLYPYSNLTITKGEKNGIQGVYIEYTTSYINIITGKLHFDVNIMYKDIHLRSEDFNAPLYKKNETTLYEDEGENNIIWSLFYKNKTSGDDSPVECFLIPDKSQKVNAISVSLSLTASSFDSGYFYYIFNTYPAGDVSVTSHNLSPNKTYSTSSKEYSNRIRYSAIQIWKDSSDVKVVDFNFTFMKGDDGQLYRWADSGITTDTQFDVNISSDTLYLYKTTTDFRTGTYNRSVLRNALESNAYNTTMTAGTLTTYDIMSIDEVDRTDAKNVKIIDFPYLPSEYKITNGKYNLSANWTYDSVTNSMKLRDNSYRLIGHTKTNGDNIEGDLIVNITSGLYDKNRYYKDSKIYHSDFYRRKFVYDSFQKIFHLEFLDIDNISDDATFNFDFVATRNIMSKFMFQFFHNYKISMEDYDNLVAVSRNNEEVLYNSSYLNYIRTGYNYDLKSKERSQVAGGAGIALSTIGTLAGIAMMGASGNYAGAVASAILGATATASSIINYAKTTAQAEENIQRKLLENQNQAVSVLNADDVDLLYSYSENKAKLTTYQVSEQMERILDDLFYYYGYKIEEQKLPNINSRYWFNFIQASLVLNDTNNLSEEIENDIKAKFEEGVTFFHYHSKFDLEQVKENMENNILS